ncbi:MAG: gamma carbonic anhydrase family protein [Clostridia bacterium]|nr:gamma carbonic anhydrase family protein [Clostridia bacterium]
MIRKYLDKEPKLAENVFLAENAAVIGDVTLDEGVNVWYGAVIRGDEDSVTVGAGSNVQDNATLHVGRGFPISVGKGVTVGHNAVVHGCTVGDDTLIGMGAVVLNGAVIGKGCIIGAGALIKEKAEIPDYSLCVGVPARIVRTLTPEAVEGNRKNAAVYRALAEDYRK